MKRVFDILAVLLLLLLFTSCWADDVKAPEGGDEFRSGSGIIAFSSYAPLSDRPVRIHYNIPEGGDMAKMPVLFVFPGLERNASDYLASWKKTSASGKVMVFVLEFPKNTYSSEQYIEGGMFENGSPVSQDNWTFSVIEPIFQKILKDTGSKAKKYDMWGHSAGAQFVHRYVTFMPHASVDRAVCANAGWYTLPDINVTYPYGLKNSGFTSDATLRHLFSTELIVQLGTADTSRDGLNTTAGAEAQGVNRFERGNFYFSSGQQVASAGNYMFRWLRMEVPGVGHEYDKMAADAAKILY